jgi:hypothetical protein
MYTGKTETCNLALAHIGVGLTIADIDTENTAEAKACRQFYDISMESVLGAFRWNFARKTAALSLVAENPNIDWSFSYAYPVDAVYFYKILSGRRNPDRTQEVPFFVGSGTSQSLIYTDMQDASGEYIRKITDLDFKPADFVMAHSLKLAIAIAPKLTKGNYAKLIASLYSVYGNEVRMAASRNAKEQRKDIAPESELITGR